MLKTVKGSIRRQNFSYSCPADIFNRLVLVCHTRGCTKSWLITKALENYLAEVEEDARDYETAATAWNEFEISGKTGISLEDLRSKLNV